jgi:hypothetical protein
MRLLDDLKAQYADWRKRKDEEEKVYKDALHEAKMKALKQKGTVDGYSQVFKKRTKKKEVINAGVNTQAFMDSFGLGNAIHATTTKKVSQSNTTDKQGVGYFNNILGAENNPKNKKKNNVNDNNTTNNLWRL